MIAMRMTSYPESKPLGRETPLSSLLRRRGKGAGALERGHLRVVVAENVLQDVVGVLAQQRAPLDLRGRGRKLDGHADVEPLAALRMVELDPHVAAADVLVVGE